MEKSQQKQYCFIHIPKTAGTSFRSMLERYFVGDEIFPRREDRLQTEHKGYPPNKSYRDIPPEEFAQIRVFVGHFPYVFGSHLAPELEMMTFLREPESRFRSQILYTYSMRKKKNPELTIEETYADIRMSIHNIQTRFLADARGQNLAYYNGRKPMDTQGLEQAMENLASCGFVGISEKFTASVCLAEKKYQWKLGRILRVNKTRAKNENLPEEILREMADATAYDKALYRYGCELFEQRNKVGKTYVFLRNWQL